MLVELFKGMALTGRYAFAPGVTIQYPEEKPLCRRVFVVCMLCAATTTVRSAALPANCAKPFAPRWPSPSSCTSVKTVTRPHHAL